MQRYTRLQLLVAFLCIAAYGIACSGDFLDWDDHLTVAENPNFNPPNLQGLANQWSKPDVGMYIPVVYTVWWLVAQVAHVSVADPHGITLNPWIFHGANLLVHTVNALLVMGILRLLTGKDWAAVAGALLFALHPLQVESVAWVTGMKDLVLGCFALLALWQYLVYATTGRRLHYFIATICLVLAMLSKPTAMVLPVMAGAIDYLILGRPWKKVLAAVLPWLAMAVPCIIWTALVQTSANMSILATPLWQRPLIAADTVAFYLYKLVFPVWLAPEYARTPHVIFQHGWAWWTWLLPAAVVGLLLWARQRWLTAAALVFLAPLLPVLGLKPFVFQYFSTVADRYAYLSLLGPGIAIAWLACRPWPRQVVGLYAVVLAVLMALTIAQCTYWTDQNRLFTHNVEVAKDSFMAWGVLGEEAYYRGDMGLAIKEMKHALAIYDRDPHTWEMLGRIYWDANYPDASASAFIQAARIRDAWAREVHTMDVRGEHVYIGFHLLRLGRWAEATEQFQTVLDNNPDDPNHDKYAAAARHGLADAAAHHKPPNELGASEPGM